MHSRSRRGLIREITSRDIACTMLDEYFDVIEEALDQCLSSERISSENW
jgi:hypothetical protein